MICLIVKGQSKQLALEDLNILRVNPKSLHFNKTIIFFLSHFEPLIMSLSDPHNKRRMNYKFGPSRHDTKIN